MGAQSIKSSMLVTMESNRYGRSKSYRNAKIEFESK